MRAAATTNRHRKPICLYLSAWQVGMLYVATLLCCGAAWVSDRATAAFSQLLVKWRWTDTARYGVEGSTDWAGVGAMLGFIAILLLFFQYALVLVGWKLFHGRLRLRERRIARNWFRSAMVAPVVICVATTLVDAVWMVVTRVGWVNAPTGSIIWCVYFLVAPVQLARLSVRRRARAVRPLCHNCGYNLTGNISGTCPECGQRASSHSA